MGPDERPVVRVVATTAAGETVPQQVGCDVRDTPTSVRRAARRRVLRWGAAGVVVLALAAVAVRTQVTTPRWSVGAAGLRGGSVAVTVTDRGVPVRVRSVAVEGEGVDAPLAGALADEVEAAQARGVAPTHDATRLLASGHHTFLVQVRPTCPAGAPPAAVRVRLDLEVDGRQRSVVRTLPATDREQLTCVALSVRAGLSPLPTATGRVTLQLTAYAGTPAPPIGFRSLDLDGYRVSGVASVVPLALGWVAAGSSVVFDAVVTPDCGARPGGGLAAVFADTRLAVPLTAPALAAVQALRSGCPAA